MALTSEVSSSDPAPTLGSSPTPPNASGFDTNLNTSWHQSVQDIKTLTVGDVAGGAVATVADFGASVWNSLPFTPEVDTTDILRRVNSNALKIYEENPDTIHAASFIGGMFVSMGFAVKGMNLMRNGVKGAHWFNTLGKEKDIAKIAKVFAEAGEGTKDYRNLTYGLYAKSVLNGTLDMAAQELMLVGMMHAHPLMEDYNKDFAKNFGLSVAFGGVLGGGAGLIADRFALRSALGDTGAAIFKDLPFLEQKPIYEGLPTAIKLQNLHENANLFTSFMADRAAMGLNETNDLRYAIAKKNSQDILLRQNEIFEGSDKVQGMLSPALKALDPRAKSEILTMIIDNPGMFGVDSMRLVKESELEAKVTILTGQAEKLSTTPAIRTVDPVTGEAVNKVAVYYPELNLYGIKADLQTYAGASALNKSAEQLAKELPFNYGKVPNFESDLELLGKNSADVAGSYIAAMQRVKGMTPEALGNLNVSANDGPLLHALAVRIASDPALKDIKIKVSDRSSLNNAIIKERDAQMTANGQVQGPTASYEVGLSKIGEDIHNHKYSPLYNEEGISDAARELVRKWIGGSQSDLRKAYVDYFTAQHAGFKGGLNDKSAEAFGEVINSKASVALRAEFSKIADADGNVLLYRGLKTNKLFGGSGLESYTTHISKAEHFGDAKHPLSAATGGGVKVFKVQVDDIVAGFRDIPKTSPGANNVNNAEIIVRAGARPIEAELSAAGKLEFRAQQEGQGFSSANATSQAGLDDIHALITQQKQDAIDTMIANGIPAESIAIKTNTDIDVVNAYMMNKDYSPLSDISAILHPDENVMSLSKIKNYDDIEKTLKVTNQPLVLNGNVRKPLYIENHIGLDARTMSNMNKEIMTLTLLGSKSTLAQELGNTFYAGERLIDAVDLLKTQLGNVTKERAGSAFWNSYDQFARHMGDMGPTSAYIGKKVQDSANRLINSVVEPLKPFMAAIAKDPAALIEYNTALSKNAELAGWRIWSPEGKLLQKSVETGLDGKQVEILKAVKVTDKAFGEIDFQIKSPNALKLILEQQSHGNQLRELHNTINKIQGKPDISDIGFWAPSFNPVNKYIAYVHDATTDTTKLIWGRTASEYTESVNAYKKHLVETGQNNINVYEKNGDQKWWSLMNNRLDVINMERADVALQKAGSTGSAIVKSDTSILSEQAAGYQHYISSQTRTLADMMLADLTEPLRIMSSLAQDATKSQPFDAIKKVFTAPKDPAAIVHNALLGQNNLGEFSGWKAANQTFETYLTIAANAVTDVVGGAFKVLSPAILRGKSPLDTKAAQLIDYEKISKSLADKGIFNPYANFDDAAAQMFGLSKLENHADTSKRLIYASNALAATAALRFGELAQPIVNAISLPILTQLAIADKMPAYFLGVAKSTSKVGGVQIMYEGARAMNSPMFKDLNKKWEAAGYFKAIVSEVSDLQRASRQFESGAIPKIENGIDSAFVKMMSKPADYSETLVRKLTMNIGAVLAKRLYPELDEAAVTIFAQDFMSKAVGNFHAAQRPVFFQGTLGVALGLFQTYSLTMAQSIYRHLEMKNYKALGKASLTQSTIFGTKSMPGFDTISNAIGDHFSDDNFDLVTGTYRSVPDHMANFVLYGLPSNLGPSFTTRGNATPQPPVLNNMVAYNFLKEVGGMMGKIKDGLGADAPEMARSMGQALSMQSMSRPLARTAELATGYSVTRQGNTVQIPEEVWTPTGVISRILSTRPLEEQKLRDADHMNRFYGAVDRDNRQQAVNKVQTAIRNGTLDDTKIGKAAEDFMRHGGSPRGWQSVLNHVAGKTEASGKETFMNKLKPDNALNFMIDNLD